MDKETQEITRYRREINDLADTWSSMQQQVDDLEVKSDEAQAQANEMIAQVKTLHNKIEDRRKEIYDELYTPANRRVMKSVNDHAKIYKDRLTAMGKKLEAKFLGYQEEKRLAAAKAEAARLEAEAKAKERERQLAQVAVPPDVLEDMKARGVEPAGKRPVVPQRVAPVTNMVTTKTGGSYTKKEKYFVLVDFSKVPDGYKTLDEVRVRKAMHDGIEIPGIEFRERDKLATRLK